MNEEYKRGQRDALAGIALVGLIATCFIKAMLIILI